MSPDEYQQAWQAQASQTRVTVNADLLCKEVQRSQREFQAKISYSDYVFIGLIVVLLAVWICMGFTMGPPWTWYLMVPSFIWYIIFILAGRARHKSTPSAPGGPLLSSAKESLAAVEHQIWSQRNIVWWYLVPMAIPLLAITAHVSFTKAKGLLDAVNDVNVGIVVFFLAIACLIHYLSRFVIRKQYEPRRQELLRLIASLGDEPTNEVSGDYPILMAPVPFKVSRRRMIAGGVCAVMLFAIGSVGAYLGYRQDNPYPKLAPFTDVTWTDDSPLIELDGQWLVLHGIDGIAAKDIVEFCKRTYKDKWQKRFAEDLVEVMTKMGHAPGDTVKLDVFSVTPPVGKVIREVAMTAANRNAVRNKAEKRALSEEQLDAWKKNKERELNEPKVPLSELVPNLRKENKLVGFAAMVTVDGKVVESAADGERKSGSDVAVTVDDRWHLGSITKSITATMIARLIEQGKMQWDDTVGEIFPDASMHVEWKAVTLRQLLTHTSGAPANFPTAVAFQSPELGAESTAARLEAVLDVIAKKPENTPGSAFAYSNVGFTIAGAMAEKATGEAWDALVKREVFEPLALTSAGFGPPKSGDKKIQQPQGHTSVFGWKFGAGEDADNTFIIGPAGIVHMTLQDLCAYGTEHLRGELGKGTLLSAETYTLLHKPELDDYACGWVKVEPSARIPHTHYWHNGSNTMWYALVVFIPDTNMVVAVASNDGDIAKAESAAWDIVQNCVKQSAAEADTPTPQATAPVK